MAVNQPVVLDGHRDDDEEKEEEEEDT